MRFLFLSHLQNAREALRAHRMRSFLTMLGITIGVASITAILALGAGASSVVGRQVEALGGTIAVVRPGSIVESGINRLTELPNQQRFAASTLTSSDLASIQDVENVVAAAPLMVLSGVVQGESTAPADTPIVATTPDIVEVNELDIRDGQFLASDLSIDTAVIGPQLSISAFGTEQSIGKTITVKGKPFTVVGILERTNTPINFNGVDFDNAVFINNDSGMALNQGSTQIQQINFRVASLGDLDRAIIDVNKVLLRNHLGQADFSVLSGEEVAAPTNQLFVAIAAVTTAIAAISLLVGGVGIMNSMLIGVAERTREIGIRKALGASNTDITAQFLIESLALSIGGGIGGFALGYAIAFVVSLGLPFDPGISWTIVLVATVVSLGVGLLFGLYPALRAAYKDPINALRQYD
ncbi:hypothetical protein CMN23_01610 [Candidatus Saccharibacteria bacterium]|nr:hypothetical protein [Candidatus Saccharibacteria bacterium]MBJ58292.1 hypothetical protein [Candidatus Saccharibacteria bacterium]